MDNLTGKVFCRNDTRAKNILVRVVVDEMSTSPNSRVKIVGLTTGFQTWIFRSAILNTGNRGFTPVPHYNGEAK